MKVQRAIVAVVIAKFAASAAAQGPEQEAIARIESLGGRVYRNANQQVDVVSLSGTKAGDDDLRRLQALPSLRSLDLDRTQVTDAGLAHLLALPNLEEVSLRGTRVTDAAAQGLKDRHPKIYRVEVSPGFQPGKLAFAAVLALPVLLGIWLINATRKKQSVLPARVYARARGVGWLLVLGSALLMVIAVLQALGFGVNIANLFG
jgi:hypothetical protein